MSWGKVACGPVDCVDHPERLRVKSRASKICKCPDLTLFPKTMMLIIFYGATVK